MAATGSPASEPRQIPVNVTTAPTSVRSRVSTAASAAASKSAVCSLMVAGMLSSRHWREKRDLLGARDRRTRLHMGAVDSGADHLGIGKGKRIFLPSRGEPDHEISHGCDAGWGVYDLLALADAFAHPGEIQKLHAHSSIRCRTPARK